MTSYTTNQGDTWDVIAFVLWGDETLFHWLIEANPAKRETVIFSAGVVLDVPDLPLAEASAPAPPWVSNG